MKTSLLRLAREELHAIEAEVLVRNAIYACENIFQFSSAHNLLENSKPYITEKQYKELKIDFDYKLKSKNITFEDLKQPKNETEYSNVEHSNELKEAPKEFKCQYLTMTAPDDENQFSVYGVACLSIDEARQLANFILSNIKK